VVLSVVRMFLKYSIVLRITYYMNKLWILSALSLPDINLKFTDDAIFVTILL
jgi:hypothetical protein